MDGDMSARIESSFHTKMTEESFWKAVDILLKKPHVVNKRLWGCKLLLQVYCNQQSADWKLPDEYKIGHTRCIKELEKLLLENAEIKSKAENDFSRYPIEITLIELMPKVYTELHANQLIILRRYDLSVTFYDVTCKNVTQTLCPGFSYTISLDNQAVKLSLEKCEAANSSSYQWLKNTVLPQFLKWGEESKSQSVYNKSLALVCNDKYYQKYNEIKLKYGKEMVKIWPECTDPAKFVYEDVAIATYLLLLWEDQRTNSNIESKQTFVDLGCGNGLLVYILSKEGHKGVGIDVRKRKIWDLYGNKIQLEEKTITPSDRHLFPDTDWLIGNHSDELTPWIPVIAARSSYKCNFFLLPCCAYNFDGSKYRRHNSSKSQYEEYLQYIKQLSEDIGFRVDTDRLKIPSTKRICLVGRGRSYLMEEYEVYCNKVQNLISSGTCLKEPDSHDLWVNNFKPRESKERVRNCTQVDKGLINYIVDKISQHLLKDCKFESSWSSGRIVELRELVDLIPLDKLKALKCECGGLQTVLKNNHQIFKVHAGHVQLRYPKTVQEVKSNNTKSNKGQSSCIKLQQKPCWFYNNHPQGCPLEDKDCSFSHKNANL